MQMRIYSKTVYKYQNIWIFDVNTDGRRQRESKIKKHSYESSWMHTMPTMKGFILRVYVLSTIFVGNFGQLMVSNCPGEVAECVERLVNANDNVTVEDAMVQCLQISFFESGRKKRNAINITEDTKAYMNSLMKTYVERISQSQISDYTSPRIRREYRMLSDAERKAYHDAINVLKATGQYDKHADIHKVAAPFVHEGPNFLGWHRVYLALYEEALRRVNPNVTLPYWDSSLDYHMPSPIDSIIWSAPFVGNGDGWVRTGPFANWRTPTNRRLTRNIGRRSKLISKPAVDDVLTRCRLKEISDPTAADRYSLEMHHNGVHNWIGGQMMSLETSSYDPIFFMHHAYIDYIWELFHLRQVGDCDVNLSTDYPFTFGVQNSKRPMVELQPYRNIDGIRLYWTQFLYRYENSPNCSTARPTCISPYLVCDTKNWRCISQTRPRRFLETPFALDFANTGTNAGMSFSADNGLNPQKQESMEVDGSPILRAPPADPRNHPLTIVGSSKQRNAIQPNTANNATDIWSLVSAGLNHLFEALSNDVPIDRNVSSANIVPRDQPLEPHQDYIGFGGTKEFMGTEPTELLPVPYDCGDY